MYLGDGFVSGTEDVVSWLASRLEAEVRAIGLSVNVAKSTGSPRPGPVSLVDLSTFAGWECNAPLNAKELGAAVGDLDICGELIRKRRHKTGVTSGNSATPRLGLCSCAVVRASVRLCTAHGPRRPPP